MPVLEITQAGINSVTSFDPSGNSPTGNFGFCNAYNVDPTTFNKTTFKSFATAAQQIAYLSSTSTGARDGYATPPNYPYQGNAIALARLGNVGSTVANQPAGKVNKVSADQVKYLHQLPNGIGNFYFNLLVVYNTIGTVEASRPTDQNMPIAFIYLFDGMQYKDEFNRIEMDTTLQYAGLAATIQYIINPTTTATLLEVSTPDLLPTPLGASTNIMLIKNPNPPSTAYKHPTTVAVTAIEDTTSGNNVPLWQFDTHQAYVETLIVSNANNSVYRTNLNDLTFALYTASNFGYIMQIISGPYSGQCRRIVDVNPSLGYVTWETAFGNIIAASTVVRIYAPNKALLEYPPTPTQSQVDYKHSLRGITPFIHGYNFVYDGMGSTILQVWSTASLNTITNIPNSNWLVSSSKTGIPASFSGFGILSHYVDTVGGYARQILRQLGSTDSFTWERNINTSTGTPTAWVLTSQEIKNILNVNLLPSFNPTAVEPQITKYSVSRPSASDEVRGAQDSDNNSIFVSKSSKGFSSIGAYWSFSSHSFYVCDGIISSLGTDMGTYRDIVLSISSGATMTNWNLDTTISGNQNARFIIQFYDSTGSVLPLYSGLARGFGVGDVTTGTNTVRIYGSLPSLTTGSLSNIRFTVHECNIARSNKIQKSATGSFTDNTSNFPGPSNQWSRTNPDGSIEKGGLIQINDAGTSITFTTPFPNKCLFFSATPWATGGSTSTSQIHVESTAYFNASYVFAVSDGGDRVSVWYAKGY